MVTSKFLRLNIRDVLSGLVLAVVGAIITAIQSSADAGELKLNLHAIKVTAVSAACAYLIKKLFTKQKRVTSLTKPVS